MIKEALEYIVGIGQPEIHDIGELPYGSKKLHPIKPDTPDPLKVSTLTSLVEYVNSKPDGNEEHAGQFVHIMSPTSVCVVGPLMPHGVRNMLLRTAPELAMVNLDSFTPLELFIPSVQASFVEGYDKAMLIKVASHVSHDTSMKVNDDGTSQQVEIQAGIRKEYQELPNPVTLAPFCTFPEIEQPVRTYVLRLNRSGDQLSARLIDADGGAWRAVAIQRIKEYLADKIQVPILA
jgi:hypothetical protein